MVNPPTSRIQMSELKPKKVRKEKGKEEKKKLRNIVKQNGELIYQTIL